MHGIDTNGRGALVIEFRGSRFSASLAFLLAIVVNKEIAKTVTSFLTTLNTSSNNGLFCCSYNM